MSSSRMPDSPSPGSDDTLIPVTIETEQKKPKLLPILLGFLLVPSIIGFGLAEAVHRGTGFDDYAQVQSPRVC